MRRTRTCPCDALPTTVTLIRIRFRRLALDTFTAMELRGVCGQDNALERTRPGRPNLSGETLPTDK